MRPSTLSKSFSTFTSTASFETPGTSITIFNVSPGSKMSVAGT
jgi:hypothetical protein